MDYDTIYNLFMIIYVIYVLAYFTLIIYVVTTTIRDKTATKIEKAKIRKNLKSIEKEEDKLWADFKRGQPDTVYVSSASRLLLEHTITQILYKYDIDRNTINITYEDYESYSIACITYKSNRWRPYNKLLSK